MRVKRYAFVFIISVLVILFAGCGQHLAVSKERPVATIGANKVFDVALEREILKSMQIIRNKNRNDFYGFSPLRTLKLLRGNLDYLIRETVLVLPGGSLDRNDVLKAADNRAAGKAKEIYDRLQKGESWDKLNEEFSQYEGKSDGGKLPPFARGKEGLSEDFYKLKPGEIFPPFQWSFGYTILRLDGITKGPDGQDQIQASMILIIPNEKAQTEEMINNILSKKVVEIVDPVIRGFQLYEQKDYDGALNYLQGKLPAPKWTDLGYYVLSLCAQAKNDTGGMEKYLRSAIDHSSELGGLRSYYEMEIGDILEAKGDKSGADYYRKAFDRSENDYEIVKTALERFERIGDDEYALKAKARLGELDDLIKGNTGGGLPSGDVVTGEVHAPRPDFGDL